ncbi:hypothetical protein RZS08_33925, partial [Arthrospira platensis SPKY1]|nr:hypothetical protein [Arthrospira platensis SPKY1]
MGITGGGRRGADAGGVVVCPMLGAVPGGRASSPGPEAGACAPACCGGDQPSLRAGRPSPPTVCIHGVAAFSRHDRCMRCSMLFS